MKTTRKQPTCTFIKPEQKAGILSTKRIARFLHLNATEVFPAIKLNSGVSGSAYREEENAAHELEAELRKASAQTYAGVQPIR